MEDKREIRKNITILALDNLIQNYTNALEDKDMDPPLSNEERELSELIIKEAREMLTEMAIENKPPYRDWETDRKSTRLNSSHRSLSRMPSSA